MMDWLTVPVLLIIGFVIIKKKLLPRLKKKGQESAPDKKGGVSVEEDVMPDFRILSFNTGDFTYTEDLAHCVEFELGKAIGELKKEGSHLAGDPFPIVMGSSLLILLCYRKQTAKTGEVEA